MANVTCPNCGIEFDSKEKKCPSCGTKNRLKICPVCGGQMAQNAKRCPKCGAKNKKPIYRRWWFWIIVILLAIWFSGLVGGKNTEQTNSIESDSVTENTNTSDDMIVGTWEASYAFDMKSKTLNTVDTSSDSATGVNFNSDGTGNIYRLQDKSVSVDITWTYIGEVGDGRSYNIVDVTGGRMNAQLMSDNYAVQKVQGCLGIQTDAGMVYFEKKSSSVD